MPDRGFDLLVKERSQFLKNYRTAQSTGQSVEIIAAQLQENKTALQTASTGNTFKNNYLQLWFGQDPFALPTAAPITVSPSPSSPQKISDTLTEYDRAKITGKFTELVQVRKVLLKQLDNPDYYSEKESILTQLNKNRLELIPIIAEDTQAAALRNHYVDNNLAAKEPKEPPPYLAYLQNQATKQDPSMRSIIKKEIQAEIKRQREPEQTSRKPQSTVPEKQKKASKNPFSLTFSRAAFLKKGFFNSFNNRLRSSLRSKQERDHKKIP